MIAISDAAILRDHLSEDEEREACALSPEGEGVSENWTKWAIAVLFGWMAWMSLLVINIDKNLAVIQGNRFTAEDGMMVLERMIDEVDELDDKLHTHEREGH